MSNDLETSRPPLNSLPHGNIATKRKVIYYTTFFESGCYHRSSQIKNVYDPFHLDEYIILGLRCCSQRFIPYYFILKHIVHVQSHLFIATPHREPRPSSCGLIDEIVLTGFRPNHEVSQQRSGPHKTLECSRQIPNEHIKTITRTGIISSRAPHQHDTSTQSWVPGRRRPRSRQVMKGWEPDLGLP